MGVLFHTELKRFGSKGEKTGWTYVHVPQKLAGLIKPDTRMSFNVKGRIDAVQIRSSLIPMGGGDFILTVNATLRKALKKVKGASVEVELEEDTSVYQIFPELLQCLEDEPGALSYFNSLTPSHQKYFSKWIESAKTDVTRTKRIAMAVNAMAERLDFGAMLRKGKG